MISSHQYRLDRSSGQPHSPDSDPDDPYAAQSESLRRYLTCRTIANRNDVVLKHERLIYHGIEKFKRLIQRREIDNDQLLGQAMIGAIVAVEDWKPELSKFAPHLVTRVVQALLREISQEYKVNKQLRREVCTANPEWIAHARESAVDERLIREETIAVVRNAVAKLPDRQRIVIEAGILSGESQTKSAAVLGVTKQCASVIQRNSHDRLRKILAPHQIR